MNWEASLKSGEADALAIIGKRKRKLRDVPLYGFAWAVLDHIERVREAVRRKDMDGALNAFLDAVSCHMQMMTINGAPNYKGWPVSLGQAIRDANIGTRTRKVNRSKRLKSGKMTKEVNENRDKRIREKADEYRRAGIIERRLIAKLIDYADEKNQSWPTDRTTLRNILYPQ